LQLHKQQQPQPQPQQQQSQSQQPLKPSYFKPVVPSTSTGGDHRRVTDNFASVGLATFESGPGGGLGTDPSPMEEWRRSRARAAAASTRPAAVGGISTGRPGGAGPGYTKPVRPPPTHESTSHAPARAHHYHFGPHPGAGQRRRRWPPQPAADARGGEGKASEEAPGGPRGGAG
jgi:hypothetical protein